MLDSLFASMSLLIRKDHRTGNATVHRSDLQKMKLSFHLPDYLRGTFFPGSPLYLSTLLDAMMWTAALLLLLTAASSTEAGESPHPA